MTATMLSSQVTGSGLVREVVTREPLRWITSDPESKMDDFDLQTFLAVTGKTVCDLDADLDALEALLDSFRPGVVENDLERLLGHVSLYTGLIAKTGRPSDKERDRLLIQIYYSAVTAVLAGLRNQRRLALSKRRYRRLLKAIDSIKSVPELAEFADTCLGIA